MIEDCGSVRVASELRVDVAGKEPVFLGQIENGEEVAIGIVEAVDDPFFLFFVFGRVDIDGNLAEQRIAERREVVGVAKADCALLEVAVLDKDIGWVQQIGGHCRQRLFFFQSFQ